MTDPLLDTPLGREAVEAGQAASRVDDFALTQAETEVILTAALPAIRRMLAEELRAADPYARVEGCEQAAHAWGVAADFVSRP